MGDTHLVAGMKDMGLVVSLDGGTYYNISRGRR